MAGEKKPYKHLNVLPPEEPAPVTFQGVDNGVIYLVDVRSDDVLYIRDQNTRGPCEGVWVSD